jgi:hypothetical protein
MELTPHASLMMRVLWYMAKICKTKSLIGRAVLLLSLMFRISTIRIKVSWHLITPLLEEAPPGLTIVIAQAILLPEQILLG